MSQSIYNVWKHVLTSYFVKLALEACFSAPARDGSNLFAGAWFLHFCGPEYFEILWLHFIACYCMIHAWHIVTEMWKCLTKGSGSSAGLTFLHVTWVHTCILGAGIQKHRVSRARPALTASATPSMSPSQAQIGSCARDTRRTFGGKQEEPRLFSPTSLNSVVASRIVARCISRGLAGIWCTSLEPWSLGASRGFQKMLPPGR